MKFQVGEIALLAFSSGAGNVGDEVEVIAIGPFPPGARYFHRGEVFKTPETSLYVIEHPATGGWFSDEDGLLKKRPPEESQVTQLKKDIERWTTSKKPVSA